MLDLKIYVYNFQNLKLLDVFETRENQKGLCSISPSKDICVLACPDKNLGAIRVVHMDQDSKTQLINAHQTAISALALNQEGNLLATASDKVFLLKCFNRIYRAL